MKKVSIVKSTISVMLILLMTSCTNLDIEDNTQHITTVTTITEDTEQLVEFDGYKTTQNEDGTFNITINMDAVDNSYYTMSLMYDDRIVEYVSGDGYYKSAYGSFDEETVIADSEDSETIVTTISKEELESKIGKDGSWVLKSTSEGTQYIEIRLIDKYGDVYSKYQFTCIVDTHLEPHIYYTTINFE